MYFIQLSMAFFWTYSYFQMFKFCTSHCFHLKMYHSFILNALKSLLRCTSPRHQSIMITVKIKAAAAAAKSLQSSPTLWPQRRQPTRLRCPWDSPGKNTGLGCHFLLQCMKVKSESEVTQSCPTLSDPTDCSPPGSPVHWSFQARVLEWGAMAFSAKLKLGVLYYNKHDG